MHKGSDAEGGQRAQLLKAMCHQLHMNQPVQQPPACIKPPKLFGPLATVLAG